MLKYSVVIPNQLLLIYKPVSFTPHQTITQFKAEHPEYLETILSYAGRLDPMAEGALLVLVGDTNKNRHNFESYDKEYNFEVLCGIATDSQDIMGIPTNPSGVSVSKEILDDKLKAWVLSHLGKVSLTLPVYSSKPVAGKPLYYHARHNTLSTITVPTQLVTIYSLVIEQLNPVSLEEVVTIAHEKITPVSGDFRQSEILESWDKLMSQPNKPTLYLAYGQCEVSSGTYIRGLVNQISKDLGIPMLLFSLKRTAVGPFTFASESSKASSTGDTTLV